MKETLFFVLMAVLISGAGIYCFLILRDSDRTIKTYLWYKYRMWEYLPEDERKEWERKMQQNGEEKTT